MISLRDLLKEFEASNYWRFIGFQHVDIGEGFASIQVQPRPELLNMQEMLHGGIIMSGLDMVMGLTARTMGAKKISTIQMETRFLKSVYVDPVLFTGKVIHSTKNTVVLNGRVMNAQNELIAYSTSTFKMVF